MPPAPIFHEFLALHPLRSLTLRQPRVCHAMLLKLINPRSEDYPTSGHRMREEKIPSSLGL